MPVCLYSVQYLPTWLCTGNPFFTFLFFYRLMAFTTSATIVISINNFKQYLRYNTPTSHVAFLRKYIHLLDTIKMKLPLLVMAMLFCLSTSTPENRFQLERPNFASMIASIASRREYTKCLAVMYSLDRGIWEDVREICKTSQCLSHVILV